MDRLRAGHVAVLFPMWSVVLTIHLSHVFSVTTPSFGQVFPYLMFSKGGQCCGSSLPSCLKLFLLVSPLFQPPDCHLILYHPQTWNTDPSGFVLWDFPQPSVNYFLSLKIPMISGPLITFFSLLRFLYIPFSFVLRCMINAQFIIFVHIF